MNTQNKIVSLKSLSKKVAIYKKKKIKIIFTNGCFDLLHYGHVRYLEKIKKKDNILIVAVNSDSSVRKNKSDGRPIQNQMARSTVIAGLACVDYVIIFNETTPEKIILALKPDVLIKGADWKDKAIAGENIVRASGGMVLFAPYVRGFSTTHIIQRIKRRCR